MAILTECRKYRITGSGFFESLNDPKGERFISLDVRDVFIRPEDKRHPDDRRDPVYVKPGHQLILDKECLNDTYKELKLGDKLSFKCAYWRVGNNYYAEIVECNLERGDTSTPLLTKKHPCTINDSLVHRMGKTIYHQILTLSDPEKEENASIH